MDLSVVAEAERQKWGQLGPAPVLTGVSLLATILAPRLSNSFLVALLRSWWPRSSRCAACSS